MDRASVEALRDLLAPSGWVDRTRRFGLDLRRSRAGQDPGGLLVVGTPQQEPWHLTAHLGDEARLTGAAELTPTLVRWSPPVDAPPHLSVGLDRIVASGRGETLFVVAPDASPANLLERISDAKRSGATVFALDSGDSELESLAHEALTVPTVLVPENPATTVDFDVVGHLVSVATGDAVASRSGVRGRLARFLDTLSGPRV